MNQQKEENDCRNYFMINLHERMALAGIKLVTLGSAVRLAVNCATGQVCKTVLLFYLNSKNNDGLICIFEVKYGVQ